jgi:hypothetical protein
MKHFIKNYIKRNLERYKIDMIYIYLVILLLCIIIFVCMLRFELILYFYPDWVIINLKDIFKNNLNLTDQTQFNLVKGYIFTDKFYEYKISLLSSSYGVVIYKKYKRKLQLVRLAGRRKEPFIRFKRKYFKKMPMIFRYKLTAHARYVRVRYNLLKNMFAISNRYQRIRFYFMEYFEHYFFHTKRHRTLRFYFVAARKVLHSFPRVSSLFRGTNIRYAQSRKYRRYNRLKNYSSYHIYKRFALYIYKNFFKNRIEPFRSHNFYKHFRRVAYFIRGHFLYPPPRGTTHELSKRNARFEEKLCDKEGFVGSKVILKNWTEGIRHRRRYRFSKYYTEKFLYDTSIKLGRRVKASADQEKILWTMVDYYYNRKNRYNILGKLRSAFDRSRSSFWMRVYARYGYKKKDYVFLNLITKHAFKKYFIKNLYNLFFYKKFDFINLLISNYFKLNDFFVASVKKSSLKRKTKINIITNLNIIKYNIGIIKYNLNYLRKIYLYVKKYFKIIVNNFIKKNSYITYKNYFLKIINYFFKKISNFYIFHFKNNRFFKWFFNWFFNFFLFYKEEKKKFKNGDRNIYLDIKIYYVEFYMKYLVKIYRFYRTILRNIYIFYIDYIKMPYYEKLHRYPVYLGLYINRRYHRFRQDRVHYPYIKIYKYIKKIRKLYASLRKRYLRGDELYGYFFRNLTTFIYKKSVFFRNPAVFYKIMGIFTATFYKLFSIKLLFLFLIGFIYAIILHKYIRFDEDEFYTRENFIFISILIIIGLNIVSNPEAFFYNIL